ncbi:MAG TPA: hypothetical protein VMW35_19425 [Myxococcota bacterium]|nr:hypothetical protein [Myxococcota bacterium]
MPRGLIVRALLLAGLVGAAPARAADPWQSYLSAHPRLAEEDLLGVSAGDDLARVLAVLYNPDAGFGPKRVRVRALGRGGARELAPDAAIAPGGAPSDGALLVDVTQACDAAAASRENGFTSWLYLRQDRLVAWDLQGYGPGCRPEPRTFAALDHDAMREVGDRLFRPAGRGPFRYGVLAYDEWDDAFAAPTRAAMLTLLQQQVDADPRDARRQQHLAVGLQANGERRGARRALERAAELDPTWRLPLENLVAVLALEGDQEALARAEQRLGQFGVGARPPADASRPAAP